MDTLTEEEDCLSTLKQKAEGELKATEELLVETEHGRRERWRFELASRLAVEMFKHDLENGRRPGRPTATIVSIADQLMAFLDKEPGTVLESPVVRSERLSELLRAFWVLGDSVWASVRSHDRVSKGRIGYGSSDELLALFKPLYNWVENARDEINDLMMQEGRGEDVRAGD